MHLLIAILNAPEKLDSILAGFVELGVRGATVITHSRSTESLDWPPRNCATSWSSEGSGSCCRSWWARPSRRGRSAERVKFPFVEKALALGDDQSARAEAARHVPEISDPADDLPPDNADAGKRGY